MKSTSQFLFGFACKFPFPELREETKREKEVQKREYPYTETGREESHNTILVDRKVTINDFPLSFGYCQKGHAIYDLDPANSDLPVSSKAVVEQECPVGSKPSHTR
jgi:hypothetical protein